MDAATVPATPPRVANLLDRAFDLYFRHPLPLILLSLVYSVVVTTLEPWSENGEASWFLRFTVPLLVNVFLSCAGNFAATRLAMTDAAGESPGLAPLLGKTALALPALIVIALLYTLALLGSMLLFIVPGIVFALSGSFAANVFAARSLQGWAAIQRSRRILKGRWWWTAIRLFLLVLPPVLLGVFFQYLPKSAGMVALESGLAALLYPLCFAGQAIVYLDLEARHEAAEQERARRVIAMTPAPVAVPAPVAPVYAAPSHAGFDADAFSRFEHRGWQSAAGAYRHGFARLTRQAAEPLIEAAGVVAGATVLDVATGPGDLAGLAAERGAHVIGVDFSPGMLAIAREHHPNVEFRVADAEALPFPEHTFDAVTMGFLVGHLSHPDRVLREAHRVLQPHRRIALSWWQAIDRAVAFGIVMDAVRLHGRMQVDLPMGPPFDQFSDPQTLGRAMEEAGFGDVRISSQPMTWRVETAEEVFESYLQGTVRTAGLLREQAPDQLLAIRAEVLRRVEELRGPNGIEIPMPCWIASGVRT